MREQSSAISDQQSENTQYSLLGTQYSAAWQGLVTSALLGTERRAVTAKHGDDALGKVLAGLEGRDAQAQLLGASAVVALYKRVGRLPEMDNAPLENPCEPDLAPCCSNRAAQHMITMLSGQFQELLGEWLRVTTSLGKRVPEELLTRLLDLGQSNPSFREPAQAVLGKRGLWLAAQRPDWKSTYLSVPTVVEDPDWETGGRDARRWMLERLRSQQPSQACELVESVSSRESADSRADFVRTFERNLSMDDEPFLEKALDDRSKQVREVAAELLAKLPESRLVARMIERTKPLLSLLEQRNLIGRKSYKIAITLPEELDKRAIRDGIEPKAKRGRGEKTGWLIEMLECVPPSVWSTRWAKSPQELIPLAFESEWKEAVLKSWIAATNTFKVKPWGEALLAAGTGNLKGFDLAPLLSLFDPAKRETLVMDILRSKKNPLDSKDLTLRMIWTLQTPWSVEMSRAILRAAREYLDSTAKGGDWEMRGSLIYFARAISPTVLREAVASLETPGAYRMFYSDSLDKFAAITQFRHEMLTELQQG